MEVLLHDWHFPTEFLVEVPHHDGHSGLICLHSLAGALVEVTLALYMSGKKEYLTQSNMVILTKPISHADRGGR